MKTKIKSAIFALAALFTAGFFASAANAQEATVWQNPNHICTLGNDHDFSLPLDDIYPSNRGTLSIVYALCMQVVLDNGNAPVTFRDNDGDLTFRAEPNGPRTKISAGLTVALPSVTPIRSGLVLYENSADGLQIAQNTGMTLAAIPPGTGQFFLDADFRETQTVVLGAQGYRSGGRTSGGGGSSGSAGAIIGGVAVVGLGIWLYNSGTPDIPDAETSFLPVAEYAENNGGRDWEIGGRYDWRKGRMAAYYEGRNSVDGFSYGSGLKYKADFWTTAFSESVRGETADYDFSLSADFGNHLWKINPQFALNSRFDNGEFATTNSFRISGEMRYDNWRFSANSDTERFRINAIHRF